MLCHLLGLVLILLALLEMGSGLAKTFVSSFFFFPCCPNVRIGGEIDFCRSFYTFFKAFPATGLNIWEEREAGFKIRWRTFVRPARWLRTTLGAQESSSSSGLLLKRPEDASVRGSIRICPKWLLPALA